MLDLLSSPYLAEVVAGLLVLLTSFALLRRAARGGGRLERLLGLAFLLAGLSFAFALAPYILGRPAWLPRCAFAGRISYDASVLAIALFTRHMFQSADRWSDALLVGPLALVCAGVALSVLEGDFGGYYPLQSRGYWLEWVGLLTPFVWLGSASLVHHLTLRRQLRLGLVDPLVCHRFLLWGLFGIVQVCSFFLMTLLYIVSETQYRWTAGMDLLLAGSDVLAVGIAWLVFFPPRFYRDWICAAARAASPFEG